MSLWLFLAFALSCAITFAITPVVRWFARRYGLVDRPTEERKIHTHAIPLLGGLGIFFSFSVLLVVLLLVSNLLTQGEVTLLQYAGVIIGGAILMIGGYLDDRYTLPARFSILAPVVAAFVVVLFGVQVEKLTHPFGGVIYLVAWQSDVLVFVWLFVVMYTTKFLDGLDGLATGVSSVGIFMILLLALTTAYFQPDVAMLSALALGAMVGFLFWNVHPARIFLGEGGSTYVGFLLGVLAVISGGKLAVALLALGIPLLDVFWILLRRWREGGVGRIAVGDKQHLHHRLLAIGWSQPRIVLAYVSLSTLFGTATLFLQSRHKLIALILIGLVMLLIAWYAVAKQRKQQTASVVSDA